MSRRCLSILPQCHYIGIQENNTTIKKSNNIYENIYYNYTWCVSNVIHVRTTSSTSRNWPLYNIIVIARMPIVFIHLLVPTSYTNIILCRYRANCLYLQIVVIISIINRRKKTRHNVTIYITGTYIWPFAGDARNYQYKFYEHLTYIQLII